MEEDREVITPTEAQTLSGLFRERLLRSPQAVAYRYYHQVTKTWRECTWQEVSSEVGLWQVALRQEGLQSGDRVGIMLANCREWIVFDQAALGLGLVTVPLYTNDRPENVAYIVNDAGIKLLLLEDGKQLRALRDVLTGLSGLKRIVCTDEVEGAEPRIVCLKDWVPQRGGELQTYTDDPESLATIVYTSGTTGRPKGVMLSHRNILDNTYGAAQCFPSLPGHLFLSFLPLSHSLERTAGYYLPMMGASAVAFARSVGHLPEDLRSVRPSVLISVPRIYEMFYNKINTGLERQSTVTRWLFELTLKVGWRRFEHQQGHASWSMSLMLWPLVDRLVARKVLAHLGGRIEYAICGGAALPPKVARAFLSLGLPIFQGYGMTESSPVVSVNRPHDNVPESIGTPLPGVEVRIGAQEELLTRSSSVMLGYWNNSDATREAIDGEGWLHTGDQARMDERGHFYIIGRLKDIIVLANGEKVPPADMELAILEDALFEQVMLVGEGRPFLALLAVLNHQEWEAFAETSGIDPEDRATLGTRSTERAVLTRIAKRMGAFPGYAQIRRVCLSLAPWTVEEGLLTPTLKARRPQLTHKFRDEIEAMYSGYR